MNTPIIRLYGFVLFLFLLLIVFTTNWAVIDAEELRNSSANKRPILEQQQIARGEIKTTDGELVAVSKGRGKGEQRRFVRDYPTGELFGHPVGYSFIDEGRSGLELSLNETLVGDRNEFLTLLDQLRGTPEAGSDVILTIDAGAQRTAFSQLGGRAGAVVAIEPKTGAIRTMASVPGYDPNEVPARLEEFNADEGDAPLVNRATQATYPPGSTMKVVTAAAALDSGEFKPDSTVDGSSPVDISGAPLENFGNTDFGQVTLTAALTNSVNTAWAQVAEELGTGTMVEYMQRFGFYSQPDLQYPPDQIASSGPIDSKGKLAEDGFDVGRVAIGQGGEEGQLLSTPLQMAIVAATVANDGVRLDPKLVEKVTDPDGRVSEELEPDEVGRVISSESAAQLTEMMANVVNEGTASGLSIGGETFAGKTGTAEIDNAGLNQPWFIAFAPVEDPQIAVAATVERCQGCSGGEVAGPIATAVIQELLGSGGGS